MYHLLCPSWHFACCSPDISGYLWISLGNSNEDTLKLTNCLLWIYVGGWCRLCRIWRMFGKQQTEKCYGLKSTCMSGMISFSRISANLKLGVGWYKHSFPSVPFLFCIFSESHSQAGSANGVLETTIELGPIMKKQLFSDNHLTTVLCVQIHQRSQL